MASCAAFRASLLMLGAVGDFLRIIGIDVRILKQVRQKLRSQHASDAAISASETFPSFTCSSRLGYAAERQFHLDARFERQFAGLFVGAATM